MATRRPPPLDPPEPTRSPRLTVMEGDAAAPRPLDARRAPSWTAPSESPIHAAVQGTPAVAQWRVWRVVDGIRTYLGVMGSDSQPEAVIDRFPGAMPHPGQVGTFLLRGVGPDGRET